MRSNMESLSQPVHTGYFISFYVWLRATECFEKKNDNMIKHRFGVNIGEMTEEEQAPGNYQNALDKAY